MPLDPNLVYGFRPTQGLGPTEGQINQNALGQMQVQQAQQKIQGLNAIRQVFSDPASLDESGQPTPQAMQKVMAVDPATGMALQQNAIAQQQRRLQIQHLTSQTFQDQHKVVADAYMPIWQKYQELTTGSHPVSPDEAAKTLSPEVAETKQRLAEGGALPPSAINQLPGSFTPLQMQQWVSGSDAYKEMIREYLARQSEDKAQRRTEEAGWQMMNDPTNKDAAGNPIQYRYNVRTGEATTLDRQPYTPGGAAKFGAGGTGAGSAAAAQEADVQTVAAAQSKVSSGQTLTPQEQAAFDAAKARIAARAQAKSGMAGTTMPEGANNFSATGKPIPDDLHGDEFLKQMRPDIANQVKALAEGRMQFPSSFALRPGMGASGSNANYWQNMLDAVARYDPTFDATNFRARSGVLNSFTSGADAKNITSLNMTIGHLGTLADTAEKLGNEPFRSFNTIKNWVSKEVGYPKVTNFNIAKAAVASELTRVFRGTGGNEADIQRWENDINSSSSPEQLKGAIGQALSLLDSRIDAMNTTFSRGMNKPSNISTFLSPDAVKTLKRLETKTGTQVESVAEKTGVGEPMPERGGAGGGRTGGLPMAKKDEGAGPVAGAKATPEQLKTLPKPASPEDAMKLTPGTAFVLPDNTIGIVPQASGGATAAPQPTPAPATAGQEGALKPPPADVLARAKQAIASGASRDAVMKRLRDNGLDPSGL